MNNKYNIIECDDTLSFNFLRPEIKSFAILMEQEMRKKDKQNYTVIDKSSQFLIDKLMEEREEVDKCLINNETSKFIDEESLHEGIILALLRNRLKEELKKE